MYRLVLLLLLISGCACPDLPRENELRYYRINDQMGNTYLMMIPPSGPMEIIKIYPNRK